MGVFNVPVPQNNSGRDHVPPGDGGNHTDPGDGDDDDDGASPLPTNNSPVAYPQSVEVSYDDSLSLVLEGDDADADTLTYEYTSPAHGTLLGSGSHLSYQPDAGYTGPDSFTFRVHDGTDYSAYVTVSLDVLVDRIIYLRADGDDNTAVIGDPHKAFASAQAGVDAAVLAAPSNAHKMIMDVGEGSFGNVLLLANFGTYVHWRGVDKDDSIIGNVTAKAADGVAGAVPGEAGGNGAAGLTLTMNANGTLRFGDLTARGGAGASGFDMYSDPMGASGNGGTIRTSAGVISGYIDVNGGDGMYGMSSSGIGGQVTAYGRSENIYAMGSYASGGVINLYGNAKTLMAAGGSAPSDGGNITVHVGAECEVVMVGAGGDSGYCGSYAGIINVEGKAGDLYASGCGTYGNASTGGDINVSGEAENINASGGSSSWGFGGTGGNVSVNGGVVGTIYALGGDSLTDWSSHGSGTGATGGSVNMTNGSSSREINVSGGNMRSENGMKGGQGGTVYIEVNSTTQGYAVTANGGYGFDGGDGGSITANGSTGIATADGAAAQGGGGTDGAPGTVSP